MQQRLDHIHGLRGIAAMAVVFQHASQFVQDAGVNHYRLVLDHINLGRFGVVLFFLISGLVVPFSFRGENPLRNFMLSRFFRLYPAYWLSIPILSYVAFFEYDAHITLGRLLANFTMMSGLFGQNDVGPGYWTLRFELLFYILTALLFWRKLLGDAVANGIFVLAALLSALVPIAMGLIFGEPGDVSPFSYFVAMFFLGMLLRRVFVDGCATSQRWATVLVPLAVLAGIASSGFVFPSVENGNVFLSPVQMANGMVLPILVFLLVLWLKPAPSKGVMYLGTISYSLYLFQDIGLIFLRYVLPPGHWPIGYVVAVIALTMMIASAVYRFVEQPMIEIGRKLTRASEAKPLAPAT